MANSPAKLLVEWYENQGRSLPWREIKDPYRIWISEIILQQTRVAQGLDYFNRFIERFPDLKTLASASQDEVLKYWEGLGYYSRARNLHAASHMLMDQYNGVFPDSWEELIKLKGIGPYTARAIGAFAFGNKVGVLDGNVFRVVSRYFNDPSPIDQGKTRKKFQLIVDEWASNTDPGEYNQAIMDLGAMICMPRKPKCSSCPIQVECKAFAKGNVESLPIKQKKVARSIKYFNFYLHENKSGEIMIRQRPENGIWARLWEIPNEEVSSEAWNQTAFENRNGLLGEMKHVLTHLDLRIRVYQIKSLPNNLAEEGIFISRDKIPIFAFSRAVLKIFDAHLPKIS